MESAGNLIIGYQTVIIQPIVRDGVAYCEIGVGIQRQSLVFFQRGGDNLFYFFSGKCFWHIDAAVPGAEDVLAVGKLGGGRIGLAYDLIQIDIDDQSSQMT